MSLIIYIVGLYIIIIIIIYSIIFYIMPIH